MTQRLLVLGSLLMLARPASAVDFGQPERKRIYDELVLVPRLVLVVPRLLLRAIAFPVRKILEWDEREHAHDRLLDAFTSRDGKIGIRPAFQYSLSFRPLVGASFFDERIFGDASELDLTLMLGSTRLVFANAHLRPTAPGRAIALDLDATYNRRDDQLYYGIGFEHADQPSRYALDAFDIAPALTLRPTGSLRLGLATGFGLRRFGDGHPLSDEETTISQRFCVRDVANRCVPGRTSELLVPGFHNGVQFIRMTGSFTLDTRDIPSRPASGGVIDGSVAYSHGLGADRSQYLRYHLAVEGLLDVWQRTHVIVARTSADFMQAIGGPIPFSELISVGGPDNMRGYVSGRFRAYSMLLFTAEYRWPMWMWADATFFLDVGGGAGRDQPTFAIERLLGDAGVGVRFRTTSHFYFRVQGAFNFTGGFELFLAAGTGL